MTLSEQGTILVVGGTGFIGSHVVERLARGGRRLIVVSRRGYWPWKDERPESVELVALDLTDDSCRRRLGELAVMAAGIVNLAGMLYRPGQTRRQLYAVHVDATRRVLDAVSSATDDRPRRLVHVSTTGVLGPTGPEPLDEDARPRPVTPYESTKLEGERIVSARTGGLEIVIVRPGLVYGPRDLHLLAWFRAIRDGRFRLIAGGKARWQPIHVDDVARGIVDSLVRSEGPGEVFHLVGREVVSVEAMARKIAGALGSHIRSPGLPYWAALTAGALVELGCRPLGIDPPLSRSRVRTLTESRLYLGERARGLLGFVPQVSLDEGLESTVKWYRHHGYL